MMITIQEIKEQIDCREFIGEYIPLRKNGKNHVGLCPFHDDTKPSLTVSSKKFKCFACGEGGDIVDFVIKYCGTSISGAIEHITGKYNLKPGKRDKRLDKLNTVDMYYSAIEKEILNALQVMSRKLGPQKNWTENTYEYDRILSEHIDRYLYVIEARKNMTNRDRKLIRKLNS